MRFLVWSWRVSDPISGAWVVRPTVRLLVLDCLDSAYCWVGSLVFCVLACCSSGFLALDFSRPFSVGLLLPAPLDFLRGLLPTVLNSWLHTWMSQPPTGHHEDVELRVSLPGGLRVVVTAPASASGLAAELLGHISLFRAERSLSPTERSFEVLSAASGVGSAPVVSGLPSGYTARSVETRDSIQASFVPCPAYLFKDSGRLCGSTLSGTDRVERAWRAGQWAKAVKDRRIGSPNRTPAIDLRPRYYAVLFAQDLENPTIFQSAASYWKCIKSLEGSNSISQSFPSELEARIYLQAAGAVDFSIAP